MATRRAHLSGRLTAEVYPEVLRENDHAHLAEEVPVVCPECAQGKHGICAGEALDPVTDEVVGCQCEEDC